MCLSGRLFFLQAVVQVGQRRAAEQKQHQMHDGVDDDDRRKHAQDQQRERAVAVAENRKPRVRINYVIFKKDLAAYFSTFVATYSLLPVV